MANWFYDTFLPSLFERAGLSAKWLTRRQTEICTQYMEKHVTLVAQFQGDYTRHNYYTTEWSGRAVRLEYSKMNGCGTIIFGMTEQERAEASAKREAEKARLEAERLERIHKNPERLAKWKKRTQDNLDRAMESLEACKRDLLAAEAAGDMAEAAQCRKDIADDEAWVEKMLTEWKKYHTGD